MDDSARDDLAKSYVVRSVVAFGSKDGLRAPLRDVNSGTLLSSPAGRLLVLTCAHCFPESTGNFALTHVELDEGIEDAIDAAVECPLVFRDAPVTPNNIDVAIALLSDEAQRRLERVTCVPTTAVEVTSGGAVGSGDWCVFAGFPAALRTTRGEPGTRIITQVPRSIAYGCVPEPERGALERYRIQWLDAVTTHVADRAPFTPPEAVVGQTTLLPTSEGTSGGPVWRFPSRVPPGAAWDPATHGRIIGVSMAFDMEEQMQHAESVSMFGDWFHDTIAKIDHL